MTVIYDLYNQSGQEIELPIAFIQPGQASDWVITFDDQLINWKEEDHISLSDFRGKSYFYQWMDPMNQEKYMVQYYDEKKIQTKSFVVKFKGNSKHRLFLNYRVRTGIDEKRGLHPIYRFDYFLYPASYWKNFQHLDLEIKIPFDHKLYSSLSLNQIDNHTWKSQFDQLPDNLYLFISPTMNVEANHLYSRRSAILLVFFLFILLGSIRFLLRAIAPYKIGIFTNIIVSILFFWVGNDIIRLKIFGYPFGFLQYLLYLLFILFIIYPFLKWLKRTVSKGIK